VARLDELVAKGLYPNRNEVIRFAIHDLVRKEN
jgi:Arc/MetJ-type ribon-helix-helix transcriptional regulator